MKSTFDRLFVLALLFIGITIHVLGSLDVQIGDASVISHYAMLIADCVAFVGLLTRMRWAYWFSIGLFIYAVGSQWYWAVEALVEIKKYESQIDLVIAQAITASLCTIGLYLLLRHKEHFVRPTAATR